METLLAYRYFADRRAAEETAARLSAQDIPVEIATDYQPLDNQVIGQRFHDPFTLKIPGRCFARADRILEEHTVVDISEVDPGYMLLSFSDEELIEVLKHKDDWGIFNYKLAEALLRERGAAVPEEKIRTFREMERRQKEAPASAGIALLTLGYASALYGTGIVTYLTGRAQRVLILPGVFALGIGWLLAYYKRTLSDGRQVWYFKDAERLQGKIILWLSLSIFAIRMLLLFTDFDAEQI